MYGWDTEYRVIWHLASEQTPELHTTSGFSNLEHIDSWKVRMKDTGVEVIVVRVEARHVGPYSEVETG